MRITTSLGIDQVAVMEGLDHGLWLQPLAVAQHLAKVAEGLLRAAQDGLGPAEDLHARHRVEPLGGEDVTRTLEVDVRGVPGQHVCRGVEDRGVGSAGRRVRGHGPAVYQRVRPMAAGPRAWDGLADPAAVARDGSPAR